MLASKNHRFAEVFRVLPKTNRHSPVTLKTFYEHRETTGGVISTDVK